MIEKSTLSKKQKLFFKHAKNVSKLSSFKRVKIGAIIVMNKKIIVGSGINQEKTHVKQYKLNKKYKHNTYKQDTSFIHAELAAITNINYSLLHNNKNATFEIYLYREDEQGNLLNCRPCISCMNALLQHNIHKIHYTTPLGFHTEIINQ